MFDNKQLLEDIDGMKLTNSIKYEIHDGCKQLLSDMSKLIYLFILIYYLLTKYMMYKQT